MIDTYWPNTIEHSSNWEWLENRKKGIGASEIAAVIGRNPYSDYTDILAGKFTKEECEKLGLVKKEFTEEAKQRMQEGNDNEPEIMRRYEEKTGRNIILYKDNIFYNPENPHLFATLDGFCELSDGKRIVVEAKYSRAATFWKKNQPVAYYIPQVQQQMYVMGADETDLIALHPDTKEFRIFNIKRNDVMIYEIILKGKDFWKILEDCKKQLQNS